MDARTRPRRKYYRYGSNAYVIAANGGIYASPITPTTTVFAGNASVIVSMSGVPAAARSAVYTFLSNGTTVGSQAASLPTNCSATCSVTLSAPVGMTSLQTLAYAAPTPSGTPLAYGTTPLTTLANQSTSVNLALVGVMATFSASLNPAGVTVGQYASPSVTISAVDAAGEPLSGAYVNSEFVVPSFSTTITDPTGQTTISGQTLFYSGIGSGPATVTVQSANYPSASIPITYAPAAPVAIDFALSPPGGGGDGATRETVQLFGSGSTSTAARTFLFPFKTRSAL